MASEPRSNVLTGAKETVNVVIEVAALPDARVPRSSPDS